MVPKSELNRHSLFAHILLRWYGFAAITDDAFLRPVGATTVSDFWILCDSFQVIGGLQQLNEGPGSLAPSSLVAAEHRAEQQAENGFIADFRWIVV
jgi:hypothetical protein